LLNGYLVTMTWRVLKLQREGDDVQTWIMLRGSKNE